LASREQKHRSIVWCENYSDILDRSDVDHECDERTDGQTECPVA